jgi:uncharacterized protein YdcH (DUF465 family)
MDTSKAKEYLRDIGLNDAHLPSLFDDKDKSYHSISELMTEFSNTENRELKELNEKLVDVLNELCHLNSCEQEGISGAMPLPEDWFKTFNKAEKLLEGSNKNNKVRCCKKCNN